MNAVHAVDFPPASKQCFTDATWKKWIDLTRASKATRADTHAIVPYVAPTQATVDVAVHTYICMQRWT